MKPIELTRGFVALVDDEDFERVLAAGPWRVKAHRNGRTFYATSEIGYMHRLILGPTDSKIQADHEDHDGLNNQRGNLRVATCTQNNRNRVKPNGCQSKYKGVSLSRLSPKKPWRAQITLARKMQHLGVFVSELDAALAYDAAAREQFGEFALCNFPPKMPCVNSAPAFTIPVGVTIP